MPAPRQAYGRVPFKSCALWAAEPGAPPLRRALSEAAEYLAELTGAPPSARQAGADLVIRVAVDLAQTGSREGYRLRIRPAPRGAGVEAAVIASTPLGAARGLSRLLGMIDLRDGVPVISRRLDIDSTPRTALRGLHLNGWAAGHPYSFRCWSEAEWLRYVDILFHEGVNLLFLWPSVDIIPVPLSREDQSYLEEVRRVVAYAREERGMEVWIMHSANRAAVSDCGVADPRFRPYWLPDAQVDLDPGRPDHLDRILASREPLYRIVDNADAFAIIDSDPGGWLGSPVGVYIELLKQTRAMIDSLGAAGPAVKLVTWLWQGWGYQSWDPPARGQVIAETVNGMRRELPEPWMLIAGTAHYLPWLSKLGVLDRTVALPYGAIEAEPSLPFTNVDPGSIDGALQGLAGFPGLAGVMGNVQCPLLQMPQIHHMMRSLGEGDADPDREGLARLLYPGVPAEVRAAIEALNASDRPTLAGARTAVSRILGQGQPTAGLIARLLFPGRTQVLEDLASQLEVRAAEAAFVSALDRGDELDALGPLVTEWFRQCLRWEAKHGYFSVLRVGRLGSLFPRPPVPRDTVRTWPPFVPCAIGLRRALAAAGDRRGERFFAPIMRELSKEHDPEKVRRGCGEAMQAMMEREQARQEPPTR